jgi:4-amino-4-deoxy-L-arabinose transferase-like glycosyltransferase
MNNLIRRNIYDNIVQYNVLIFIILSLGTALRLFHYYYNRSLWMDEIYLSSSFSHFNYTELATKMLDYDQKAPIGFLWLVKFSVDLFGYNEMALRLIPLLAGITSILIFVRVSKYFLQPRAQLLAISIFAFSPALIYHSVEIKQYPMECLATVSVLYLFIRYKDSHLWKDRICWGLFGALMLWFSFSVIFMLAGIACGISLSHLIKRKWKLVLVSSVPFLIWLASFVLNFILFTHKHADSGWVVYFFKIYDNFMPFPPKSVQQFKWFSRNFYDLMDYPLGMILNFKDFTDSTLVKIICLPVIPIIFLLSGMYWIYKKEKINFYILLFPVLFTLIASGLYLYPLLERFWVFIAPVFILFIGAGFEYFQQKFKSDQLVWLVYILVLAVPVFQSGYFCLKPEKFYKHKKSFEKEALVYVDQNFREGDVVYNYWNNAPGYSVYKNIFDFKYKAIQGQDWRKKSVSLQDYNDHLKIDFAEFRGKKRVWLIFNTQFLTDIGDMVDDPKWYYKSGINPTDHLILQFNKLGKPVRKMIRRDIAVYLFEL